MFEGLKREWKQFRDARPGERFRLHQACLKEKARWQLVVRAIVGVLVFAAGLVMLFVPGPGLLFMVFGLALFAGQSRVVAGYLDRGEVAARAGWGKLKRWWLASTPGVKVTVVALATVVAASVGLLAYRWFLA